MKRGILVLILLFLLVISGCVQQSSKRESKIGEEESAYIKEEIIAEYLTAKQESYKVQRDDCAEARLTGLPSRQNINNPLTYAIEGIPYYAQESKITGFSAVVKMVLDKVHPGNGVTQAEITESMIGDIWQEKTQTYDFAYLHRKHGREGIIEELHKRGVYTTVYFPAQYMYSYFDNDLELAREYLRDCGDNLEFTSQYEDYIKDILSNGDPIIYRDRVNLIGEYNVHEPIDTVSRERYIFDDNPRTDLKYKEYMDSVGQAVLVYGYGPEGFRVSNPWKWKGDRSGQYVQAHMDNSVDQCLEMTISPDLQMLKPVTPLNQILSGDSFELGFEVENHRHESMMKQFPIRSSTVEFISNDDFEGNKLIQLGTVELGDIKEDMFKLTAPNEQGVYEIILRFSGDVSSHLEGDVPYIDLDLLPYTYEIWYEEKVKIEVI